MDENLILCPCTRCTNCDLRACNVVEEHLVINGFLPGYTQWVCHGECSESFFDDSFGDEDDYPDHLSNNLPINDDFTDVDDMEALVEDAFGIHDLQLQTNSTMNQVHQDSEGASHIAGDFEEETSSRDRNEQYEAFSKLMGDANIPLRDCSKFSKLGFIVRLFQMKCLNGWSGKSFTMLLQLMNEAFPEISIPNSADETKKFLKRFDLGYEKIAACPNDCMLFWGENKNMENCEVCGSSKWVETEMDNVHVDHESVSETIKKKKFAKILRYFPLIPRLQRLFMSSKTSTDMRWHAGDHTKDRKLRHPVDAKAWKSFDERYPDFAEDPRNVKLGLASNGFNPYEQASNGYSIWPVVLVVYNLPPWACISFFQ